MNANIVKMVLLAGVCMRMQAWAGVGDTVVAYPVPPAEVISSVYQVTVNGVPVPVIRYQGTESTTLGYATFGFSGSATVTVTLRGRSFPAGRQLSPHAFRMAEQVSGSNMQFTLDRPRKLVLHYGGAKGFLNADGIPEILFIFANPLEANPPRPGNSSVIDLAQNPVDNTGASFVTTAIQTAIDNAAQSSTRKTVYVGPGTYNIDDHLNMKSGVTLYLAPGALIRVTSVNLGSGGMVNFSGVSDAALVGRGTLHVNGSVHRGPNGFNTAQAIRMNQSTDCVIEGLTIRDGGNIHVYPTSSSRIDIRDINIMSHQLWPNTDGVDFNDDCWDNTVSDVFVYNTDDPMAPGFARSMGRLNTYNCVFMTTAAAIKQSVDPAANAEFNDFTYENIYAIASAEMLYMWPRSSDVHNYFIKNVHGESFSERPLSIDCNATGAHIYDVTLYGFHMPSRRNPDSPTPPNTYQDGIRVWGADAASSIDNLVFDNVYVDSNLVTGRQRLGELIKVDSRSWAFVNNDSYRSSAITTVEISATDRLGAERPADDAVFEIRRSGAGTAQAMTVHYRVRGSALGGADYAAVADSVRIAAGSTTATIRIRPVADTVREGVEHVLVSLLNKPLSTEFVLGADWQAMVSIVDDAGGVATDGRHSQAGGCVQSPDGPVMFDLSGRRIAMRTATSVANHGAKSGVFLTYASGQNATVRVGGVGGRSAR